MRRVVGSRVKFERSYPRSLRIARTRGDGDHPDHRGDRGGHHDDSYGDSRCRVHCDVDPYVHHHRHNHDANHTHMKNSS